METTRWQRWILIGLEASCALLGLALGWLLGVDPLATVRATPPALGLGAAAAAPILVVAALVARSGWSPVRLLMRLVDELVVPFFRDWTIAEMAVVSAAAGFSEELLFRGALQGFLGTHLGSVTALVIASVVFGLVHYLSTAYAVLATLIGVYLGWLWLATGNLVVPMVAHGLYDFLALVWLTRIRTEPSWVKAPQAGESAQ